MWTSAQGSPLFASPDGEPRARRPTDAALAIASVVVLVVAGAISRIGADLDLALSELLRSLPGFLDALWKPAILAAGAWAVFLLAAALVRRRLSLARDIVASTVAAVAVALLAGAVAGDDAWHVVTDLADVDGPPGFPPGLLTVTTAAISSASPHLTLPYRHLGRWLIGAQFTAAVFLGATFASGGIAAIAIGLLGSAAVHLVVGSPGGRPDAARIRIALEQLGIHVDDLRPLAMHRGGAVLFEGADTDGPLLVKVYGRDAWDGQVLSTLWRLAWYRDTNRTARLSRIELVEHEGFVTLLAERSGVPVPHLVTAGSAGRGDALVVVRRDGTTLSEALTAGAPITDNALASLWSAVTGLHAIGITHRQVDVDRVVLRPDGTFALSDLSSASVSAEPSSRLRDRAQVLALSILLVDEDQALAIARRHLGDDGLLETLPYLQEAAVPPLLRTMLGDTDVDLDATRKRFAELVGAEEQPLVKLRRVTWGSLLNLALLALAAYSLIGLFSDLDLETFAEELVNASWWWLAFALLLAQLARIPSAISTLGSLNQPLPFGPLLVLQYAITYVNLAIPSTAARVATNVRFFQRFGVRPTAAISAGVIDSVAGFVVQILLLVTLLFVADVEFELDLDPDQLSGLITISLIVIAVLVVLAVVALAFSAVRRRVVSAVRDAATALSVLRSPTKLVQLVAGNLANQVLFAVALGACVRGFGDDVSLSQLIVINTLVSLFAGLMPIPGGIGVTEAGLTLGLTTVGLSPETAFAAALAYRFGTFYLPPIWGGFCYRWLIRKRYL